uniref:Large subunit GTPase 1 n=1 Tax=Noccaea caerulescens TaxID=107243 RepID=A0A1J3J582_NOCCA
MGKNEKTALGRALVKHHNHVIQETKEKGKNYKHQNKKVLESVTEVSDIDAIIENAEEAERLFAIHHESATPVPINMDTGSSSSGITATEWKEQRKREEALHASSLQVPRRPPWTPKMNVEQLDVNEKQAFLTWRRKLASLEENEKLVLTPFEKNLDIWRQLWRVLERSDLIVMVVDARDPLFYRCPDLEAYAREIDEHKKTMLLVNKADLLPSYVREKWAEYFSRNNILFVFWSAKAATATLEGKPLKEQWRAPDTSQKTDDPAVKVYGRDELLDRLKSEAQEIVKARKSRGESTETSSDSHRERVVVGFVGYPNVGKSSTINALVGQKRTGVTSTPGKTKHFQTLIISEELMLCDCPGLVFPSFSSSRYDMIACGVLPIDRMTEHREAVKVVAERVPRQAIEEVYNISLPKPKAYEFQFRPPLASELLKTYCLSRGYVAASGLPDETRAARQILKDYIEGKLPHFAMPPPDDENETGEDETGDDGSRYEEEGEEAPSRGLGLDEVLEDLSSFDLENGIGALKKKQVESHKQHKKP